MIKRLILSIALVSICQTLLANNVDDLKTDGDVVKFITSLDKIFTQKYSQPIILKSPGEILDKECKNTTGWEVKTWEKLDINNDGHSDLLVNGYWNNGNTGFVAMDQGNNTFKLFILRYSVSGGCELIKPLKVGKQISVLFHSYKSTLDLKEKRLFRYEEISNVDTLVYKFDDFIELHKNINTRKIDSVKFETSLCYGTCPAFTMSIDKSGNAIYNAGAYDIKHGIFNSSIKSKYLHEIYDLLNYIDVKNLKDDYQVNWSDFPSCSLTISFKDGTVKRIRDYGELGTFGLRKLYSLFFALRTNQDWKKIN